MIFLLPLFQDFFIKGQLASKDSELHVSCAIHADRSGSAAAKIDRAPLHERAAIDPNDYRPAVAGTRPFVPKRAVRRRRETVGTRYKSGTLCTDS